MPHVALIQHAFQGDSATTVDLTESLIAEAAQNGADLAALQELHCTEYFCQCENTDLLSYASDFETHTERFSQIAKKHKIVIVGSFFEKRAPGLYHNTAVVFEKDGSRAGIYRKMHIPDDPGFYEKFYFTPGDLGFEPIQTSVGKLGVLVCWDQWFPEAARLMTLKGAEMLIYPTAIGWFESDPGDEKRRQLEAWQTIQRSHAIANGIPVLSVNRIGTEHDPSGVLEGTRFWGRSFVAGPQGELLAQAQENQTILYADLDSKRTADVRDIWPFLRDRRIDAYSQLTQRFID